jgi:hypothetical protein
MRSAILAFCGAVALGIATSASSHHSTANFDFTRTATVTGTVHYFSFTNPHSFIDLEVPVQGAAPQAYKIFTVARVVMTRTGWGVDDLKAGDKVTITGSPDRKDPSFMYLNKIVFANGTIWERDPALQK